MRSIKEIGIRNRDFLSVESGDFVIPSYPSLFRKILSIVAKSYVI